VYLQRLAPLIRAVEAVQAVQKAKKRKPPTRPGVTFFSEADTWLFNARADTKVCRLCRLYEQWGEIRGDQLRTEFPYLKIIDENMIAGSEPDGRGLVHPNCRCFLTRLLAT